MRPYAERRQARIERLRARAERARAEGAAKLESARRVADGIPFGQPILVGHHSERRHRRDIQRIHDRTGAGLAKLEESRQLARRADAAEKNGAISSDDPEALTRLRAKLAAEEASRERWKAIAKAVCKADAAALAALALTDRERSTIRFAPGGDFGFAVTNLSGNIRRTKARIAELEARAARPPVEPVTVGDITVDEEDNRTRVHFPGKPSEAVRAELKRSGFHWCSSDGCWQRMASDAARAAALRIVGGDKST